jgi:hypothetical protein
MKNHTLLAALLAAPFVFAQETPPPAPPKEKPAKLNLLAYKAPKTATNVERKDGDGASRARITLPNGKQIILPDLYVLTPKQGAALTTKAQPSLFTFQTAMCPVEYRVTIMEAGQPEAAFIYAVSRTATGIHRVDLSEFDVTLKPGVEYKWVAVFRPDPSSPSNDLEANGRIMRIEPDVALAGKIKAAAPWELPGIFAEGGIWYDALAAISDQIAANPQDKELLEIRANLLKQVDLNAAAAAKAK